MYVCFCDFFFVKQKTAYEMRISDWSSDVCSSDLRISTADIADSEKTAMFNSIVSYVVRRAICGLTPKNYNNNFMSILRQLIKGEMSNAALKELLGASSTIASRWPDDAEFTNAILRSEEHTSELQSLMRISYAVFCLKKKK